MAFEKQLIAAMNNPQAAAAWRECQELDEAYDGMLETAEHYLEEAIAKSNENQQLVEKSELLEAERDALAVFAETVDFAVRRLTYALSEAEGDLAFARKIFALLVSVLAIFLWGAIMGALR